LPVKQPNFEIPVVFILFLPSAFNVKSLYAERLKRAKVIEAKTVEPKVVIS